MSGRRGGGGALDMETAAHIAATMAAIAGTCEVLAARIAETDARVAGGLKLTAAAAGHLERVATTLGEHSADLNLHEARLEALEARLATLEIRHDHLALSVVDHLETDPAE